MPVQFSYLRVLAKAKPVKLDPMTLLEGEMQRKYLFFHGYIKINFGINILVESSSSFQVFPSINIQIIIQHLIYKTLLQ